MRMGHTLWGIPLPPARLLPALKKPAIRHIERSGERNNCGGAGICFSLTERGGITMDTPEDHSDLTWGARVNTIETADRTEDCPAWATLEQQHTWSALGVVWWDHTTQQMFHLEPVNALGLLTHLQTTDAWHTQGLIIELSVFLLPAARRARKRQQLEALPPPQPQVELCDPMSLTPTQARALLQLLEAHEAALRELAEPILRQRRDSLDRARTYLLGVLALKEAEQIDFATRPLPWTANTEARTWSCDLPPNRGTVHLALDNFMWQGCLERPHKFKCESPYFGTFETALDWVEQELLAAAEAARTAAVAPVAPVPLSLATLTPTHRKRLKRYWIDPRHLSRPIQRIGW